MRRGWTLAAAAGALLSASVAAAFCPNDGASDEGYIRGRSRDGFVSLEIATRSFRPADGVGPRVTLAGVVHIGDRRFYDELVEILGESEIVLYESVLPRGAFGTDAEDDTGRQRRTQEAMLFLRSLIEREAGRTGEVPSDAAALRQAVATRDSRLARPIDLAFVDGWGRPLGYAVEGGAFALCSLGADGRRGGSGAALDLVLGPTRGFSPEATEARAKGRDLYRELADALEVELQVRSIDYDRPGWEPADLPMEELLDRLWRRGERSATLSMLEDSDGLQMRVVRFLLSLVSRSSAFKKVVIQALGSDRGEGAMPEVDRRLILDERNEAVLEAFERLRASATPPGSIAIFYGAAHMRGFEEALVERFGYIADGGSWLVAMSVDDWSDSRLREAIGKAEAALARLDEAIRDQGEVPEPDADRAALDRLTRRRDDIESRLESMRRRLERRADAAPSEKGEAAAAGG